jgi:hypothetical protein
MPRILTIGDVHGCLDELLTLLDAVRYTSGDSLVFTGDLVDRGPNSIGVVRFVRRLYEAGVAAVTQGNHDDWHVRWARHEATRRATSKPNPMKTRLPKLAALNEQLVAEGHITWLASLPTYLKISHRWLVVHAGFRPGRRDRDSMLHVRFIDPATGNPIPTPEIGRKPPGGIYWTAFWTGPESVIYGHNVDDLGRPRIDRPQPGVTCVGIDTGCVFGGHLTCTVLHDPSQEMPEFVQVPARRAYAEYVPTEE